MKYTATQLFILLFIGSTLVAQPDNKLPDQPMDGKCYSKATKPDKFEVVEKEQVISPATTKEELIPPQYDTVETKVVTKEAYTKYITIPPVYDTIDVKVPKKEKSMIVRETYETVITKKKTSEEGGRWVKVKIPNCYSQNEEDCYTMQWLPDKPQYESKEYLVGVGLDEDEVKGEYELVKKVVIKEPSRVTSVYVPEEYKMVKKAILVKNARKKVTKIPEKKRMVKQKVLVEKGGGLEWVEVLCPDALTEIVVSQVQLALKGRSFYKGAISGKLDAETQDALEAYQKAKDLPIGKLDKFTIEALGFNYVIFSQPITPRS